MGSHRVCLSVTILFHLLLPSMSEFPPIHTIVYSRCSLRYPVICAALFNLPYVHWTRLVPTFSCCKQRCPGCGCGDTCPSLASALWILTVLLPPVTELPFKIPASTATEFPVPQSLPALTLCPCLCDCDRHPDESH